MAMIEMTSVGDPMSAGWRMLTLPASDWAAQDAPWRDLAAHALERNVFHEPAFLKAARGVVGDGVRLKVLVDAEGRWLAAFPVLAGRVGFVSAVPMLLAHAYGPLGTPLVSHQADPAGAWQAFFDDLAREGAAGLMLAHLRAQGLVWEGLVAACAASGRPMQTLTRWQRPILRARVAGGLAPTRHVSRRSQTRLARMGDLALASTTDPAEIETAMAGFMALEAGGWKGQRRTALASTPATHGFALSMATRLAAEQAIRIDTLALDGRPVASLVNLIAGLDHWAWKIAYDEALARYSVGRQVLWAMTQRLHDSADAVRGDSLAMTEGGALADLWPERMPMADVLVATRPAGGLRFAAIAADVRAFRAARDGARDWRDRLRAAD